MKSVPGYYTNPRAEILPFLPADYRTVLEIGCGAGVFAQRLVERAEVWGIEPSPAEADKAARHLHRVLRGRYEEVEAQIPRGHFDLAICNDVIEHIAEPDTFLASVATKLRPGGVLVGSVPNVRFVQTLFALLVLRDWRYQDSGVMDRTHLRFFTAKSLRRLLREQGFVVEELRGINSAFRLIRGGKSLLKAAGTAGAIAATLGWSYDIQFQQYGFRARLPGSNGR